MPDSLRSAEGDERISAEITISVLIAAYNAGPYIREALKSIRAQTYSNWELIVLEDGSMDGTDKIVAEFSQGGTQKVQYLNPGVNRGVSVSRSVVLSKAGGEAIAFLDADDYWHLDHLKVAARRIAEGADVVVADVRAFDLSSGQDVANYHLDPSFLANPVEGLMLESRIVTCSAIVMRTELAQRVGDFDASLRIGEDRDFWLRAALCGARFVRGQETCNYAKHSASAMSGTALVAQDTLTFFRKHMNDGQIPMKLRRDGLAKALLDLGRLTRRQDPRESLGYVVEAWKLRPWSIICVFQALYSSFCCVGFRSRLPDR